MDFCAMNESGDGYIFNMLNRFRKAAFAKRTDTNEVDTS